MLMRLAKPQRTQSILKQEVLQGFYQTTVQIKLVVILVLAWVAIEHDMRLVLPRRSLQTAISTGDLNLHSPSSWWNTCRAVRDFPLFFSHQPQAKAIQVTPIYPNNPQHIQTPSNTEIPITNRRYPSTFFSMPYGCIWKLGYAKWLPF